jgi:hypothetical protein
MNFASDRPHLAVNSAIEGIAWPGIPAANGAALLAILFQLEQSQWWTPERIAERQGRQLKALLAHARTHVPFYRKRLRGCADLPEGEGWLAAWRQIPPLTRADIQASEADESMIADALPPGHGELREIYTSGSTGTPIRSVRTQLWELIWSAFTVRDHLWHRRDLNGKLAGIRESGKGKALYPEGTTAPSWSYSSATVFATGPMISLNVTTPVDKQAEWLQRQDPDYRLTHPEPGAGVGHALPGQKHPPAEAEAGHDDRRESTPGGARGLRAAWNAPIADIYSTREVGYLALQCPDHEHYHVQSEGVFVEVLDDSGRPCAWPSRARARHAFAQPRHATDPLRHRRRGRARAAMPVRPRPRSGPTHPRTHAEHACAALGRAALALVVVRRHRGAAGDCARYPRLPVRAEGIGSHRTAPRHASADGRGGERACQVDRAQVRASVSGEICLCRRPAAHRGRKIRGFFVRGAGLARGNESHSNQLALRRSLCVAMTTRLQMSVTRPLLTGNAQSRTDTVARAVEILKDRDMPKPKADFRQNFSQRPRKPAPAK